MTLRQLEIFWAVAHAESLTKASKTLGLAQPTLSQQLSKLEQTVGFRLFDRTHNQLRMTDAGRFLLRKAEAILANVEEAVAGINEFAHGARGLIAVGALNSIARMLMPETLRRMRPDFPGVEIDVHEVAPAEALDLLYGRRLNVAILAAGSIASSSISFKQIELTSDPYVLAVPRGIDLSNVRDVDADLPEAERSTVNRCIQFNFGTQHTRRVEEWYREVLPRHKVLGQTRTYEVALSLVQAGLGVALVPALAALLGPGRTFDATFYRVPMPERKLVALAPTQFLRLDLYSRFLTTLQEVAAEVESPKIEPTPPFLKNSAGGGTP
jgi:DNA-binding transcriptional LysR family regulator